MAFGLIYLIIDSTNDKEYVGQTTRTVEERFAEHKHCKTSNIGRAIRKRGEENFITAILKVCDNQEELNYWEKHFIVSRGTRYPDGYNNSEGGEGGWERTTESISKMSRAGMKHADKSRELISQSLIGKSSKPHSEESKAISSASCPNKRKVICVETGIIYESLAEAARAHNLKNRGGIATACKDPEKTADGCHWKFIETSR